VVGNVADSVTMTPATPDGTVVDPSTRWAVVLASSTSADGECRAV
jgi:hypothetical protein